MDIPDVPDVDGAKDLLRYAIDSAETEDEDVLDAIELLVRSIIREELSIFAEEYGLMNQGDG